MASNTTYTTNRYTVVVMTIRTKVVIRVLPGFRCRRQPRDTVERSPYFHLVENSNAYPSLVTKVE